MKDKISITTSSFAEYNKGPIELLEKNKFEVVINTQGRKLTRDETVELCSGSVGIVAGTEDYDSGVLKRLKGLKTISRCGVGTENIDIGAIHKMGIKLFNTPDAPTLAVSELTVGLILNLLRKVNFMANLVMKGKWQKQMGNLLYGKRVGIVGFGRIGQKVGELLTSFGAELNYCDIEHKPCEFTCPRKEIKKILRWADIISLHVSGKDQIIGEKELGLMKKGAWLINVSRGSAVDEGALYKALKEGHLAGAAIDVFEKEPYQGPLMELENVILTPHIGSYAKEARIKMEIEAVENLLKGLEISD